MFSFAGRSTSALVRIETGSAQKTRFHSADMTARSAGLSKAGQCRNVCIVKLSHFKGSLHAGSLRNFNRSAVLGGTNWRCWYDHLDKSGGYVINEAGDEPFVWQCWNRPECSNVDSHRLARIGD